MASLGRGDLKCDISPSFIYLHIISTLQYIAHAPTPPFPLDPPLVRVAASASLGWAVPEPGAAAGLAAPLPPWTRPPPGSSWLIREEELGLVPEPSRPPSDVPPSCVVAGRGVACLECRRQGRPFPQQLWLLARPCLRQRGAVRPGLIALPLPPRLLFLLLPLPRRLCLPSRRRGR